MCEDDKKHDPPLKVPPEYVGVPMRIADTFTFPPLTAIPKCGGCGQVYEAGHICKNMLKK